jgi:D-alanyl-lipoteichoic acid acyltransferase DltB (MBOAT superfamily)
MLFNTHLFIFAFLPLTLVLYLLGRRYMGLRYANGILALCSLFFYGWWDARYILLIVGSIVANFGLSRLIGSASGALQKWLLGLGVIANLAVLGFFKYTGFLLTNVNTVLGTGLSVPEIVLPIGISFYTFQQIAFLIDTAVHEEREKNFIDYCLFISFFPQLIAGPIVFHKEMMPQFARRKSGRRLGLLFAVGVTLFVIGLSKKVLIADTAALFSSPVFDATLAGTRVSFLEAWAGVLAYTFQIYFDFSGYSDMAAGLALMFGIKLPVNFFSPYKAASIIDFWRRWHITLSRFLRDSVYVPLGGNRRGEPLRFANVFTTMVLGGVWHGAAWTFVIWGALHGAFICVNHFWRKLAGGLPGLSSHAAWNVFCRSLTFVLVVIAWAFFRAESIDSAVSVLSSMFGGGGFGLPAILAAPLGVEIGACAPFRLCTAAFPNKLASFEYGGLVLVVLLLAVWFAPNSFEVLRRYRPMLLVLDNRVDYRHSALTWRPTWGWGALTGVLFAACTVVMTGESEFLYFQF